MYTGILTRSSQRTMIAIILLIYDNDYEIECHITDHRTTFSFLCLTSMIKQLSIHLEVF